MHKKTVPLFAADGVAHGRVRVSGDVRAIKTGVQEPGTAHAGKRKIEAGRAAVNP